MAHKTLVTIIAFNEAHRLPQLLSQFPGDPDYHLLCVDDGSTDGTDKLLQAAGHDYIRHDSNIGVGASLRDSIRYGISHGFQRIVVMAGNGKMLPGEIERLLKPLDDGRADFVQGSRILPGGSSPNLPLGRKIAIKGLTTLVSLFMWRRMTDVTCGFRAYNLDIFKNDEINIDQGWLDRYELEYYILFKALDLKLRVVEVPVSMVYPAQRTNYSKIRPFTGWWSIIRPWLYLILRLRR